MPPVPRCEGRIAFYFAVNREVTQGGGDYTRLTDRALSLLSKTSTWCPTRRRAIAADSPAIPERGGAGRGAKRGVSEATGCRVPVRHGRGRTSTDDDESDASDSDSDSDSESDNENQVDAEPNPFVAGKRKRSTAAPKPRAPSPRLGTTSSVLPSTSHPLSRRRFGITLRWLRRPPLSANYEKATQTTSSTLSRPS